MDRDRKHALAELLRELEAAVLVATHDPEFVAAFARARDPARRRVGDRRRNRRHEVLAGGSYFATETARILGGAGGALDPRMRVALLIRARAAEAIA